jgi:nitroreductase
MLLMAHGLGLAAVWLGEILAQAEAVRLALGVSEEHELMAVMALGWPAKEALQGIRKPLEDLVLDRLE